MLKKITFTCFMLWACMGPLIIDPNSLTLPISYSEQQQSLTLADFKKRYSLPHDLDAQKKRIVDMERLRNYSSLLGNSADGNEPPKSLHEKLFLYTETLRTWKSKVYLTPNSNETTEIESTSWMQLIPNDTPIALINIFGTHDTAAYRMSDLKTKFAQCQKLSIVKQLASGVRILDIRLVYDEKNKELYCCHGKGVFQCDCYHEYPHKEGTVRVRIRYHDVLFSVCSFLKSHPTETVIIAPKHESGDKDLTVFHMNLVHAILEERKILYTKNEIPRLGDVRGKIVLWDKKGSLNSGIKILTDTKSQKQELSGISFWIHKQFKLRDGDEKISLIEGVLRRAERLAHNNEQNPTSFMTYTSGFATKFFLPDPTQIAKSVNKYMYKRKYCYGVTYGWFMMDFITSHLMQKLILTNFYKVEVED